MEVALVSPLSSLQSVEAARLRATYHQRRNEARAAIADHQAKWPAVEMSKGIEVYRADVGRLHTDQQAFRSWLRNEFIPIAAALVRV
ncbi:MAG: hypothetical protein EOO40_02300 [Deltaproteobacteria bacterium]|nr:MAG: hypothetical protein EOO40_02300 [Deltaproteobacteria bacterium]